MPTIQRHAVVLGSMIIAGATAHGQVTSSIFFDNEGPEAGVTFNGATDFSLFGASFTGGEVVTEGVFPLYASGFFAYEILPGGVTVTFDTPIDNIDFFYVHVAEEEPAGTVTLFDADNNVLGTGASSDRTFFADPANFLAFDPVASIARVTFDGGHLDNFSFTTVPSPAPIAAIGLFSCGWVLRRRR